MSQLVGRVREADLAGRLLASASGGAARLLLVAGESGIGKTHFVRFLADRAAADGALVLWGAGYENLAVPYLPVASALRPLLADDPALAQRLVGTSVRDGPVGEVAESGRLSLFHAVTDAVASRAADRVVVLVMDDLQWVDPASLDLVTHLLAAGVHAAPGSVRLLLVATYRTPLDEQRIVRTVARLRREPGATEIQLRPLEETDVHALLCELGPAPPSSGLLHAVHHAAGGNPLLVREVLRQALERGAAVRKDDAVHLAAGSEVVGAAVDIDAAVRSRVASIDGAVRQTLQLAALLGEDWTADELAAVTGVEPDTVARVLALAEEDDLVVPTGGRYRFGHPQIRHALFNELRGQQRQQAHLRIADGLERRGDPTRTIAVFRHLAWAGPAAGDARTVRAAVDAGRRALALGAWADAAAALEVALGRLPSDTPWQERVDLLVLGLWAAFHDFDLDAAERYGREAVELSRAHEDVDRWGAALLPLARTRITQRADDAARTDAELSAYLEVADSSNPCLRAQLFALRAEAQASTGALDAAAELASTAAEESARCNDPSTAYRVAFAGALVNLYRLDLDEARRGLDRADEAARRVQDDPWPGMGVPARLILVDTLSGDLGRADERVAAGNARQREYSGWAEQSLLRALAAMVALARGRFQDAEHYARDAEVLACRSGFPFTPPILYPVIAQARLLRADPHGAHDAIARWEELGGRGTFRVAQAVDALSGSPASARRAIAARPWPNPPSRASLDTLLAAALQAEVGIAVGDLEMAGAVEPLLRDAHARGVRLTVPWVASVARLLGELAVARGAWDAAAEWIRRAERETTRLPIESARVRLALGHLELRRPGGDQARGTHLVTDAAESLDRAGALGLMTSSRGRAGGAPARRTILFTDLVRSTELNVQAGDATWMEIIRTHDALVGHRLRLHGGVVFKHLGDGIAAWFDSADDAIECATRLREDLIRGSAAYPELPMLMRAGLAAGDPIGRAGDLFGLAVTAASRICDLATDGQVLVSDEVAALVQEGRHPLRSFGRHRLKGFPDEQQVYEVETTVQVEQIGHVEQV